MAVSCSYGNILMLRRYDLSIALLNGSSPTFYQGYQEPVIPYPKQLVSFHGDELCSQDMIMLIRQLDDDLLTAYQTLRRFCSMVNFGTRTQQKINPEIIHETMTSVMYRLLNTSFIDGSIDQAVQIGLLAFSYHLFIQWQDIRLPYQHFPRIYRDCIQTLKVVDSVSPRLMLWLLMTGAISLFNVSEETWLKDLLWEYVSICQVRTWKEMRDILKSFMWIPLLDEQMGKQIYEEIRLHIGEEELDQVTSL
jgi:hypothetical protein